MFFKKQRASFAGFPCGRFFRYPKATSDVFSFKKENSVPVFK